MGQLDDGLINAIERLTRPQGRSLPTAPEIEQRKAEIRAAYYKRLGQKQHG